MTARWKFERWESNWREWRVEAGWYRLPETAWYGRYLRLGPIELRECPR